MVSGETGTGTLGFTQHYYCKSPLRAQQRAQKFGLLPKLSGAGCCDSSMLDIWDWIVLGYGG